VSVGPRTPVLQVAMLLREHRIGGVPVVAEGKLVGIVSGKDLLHRQELGTEHPGHSHAWWRRVMDAGAEPDQYVKSHGRCAEHVMTSPVIVAQTTTPLHEVMGLFDRHRIGRVPVLDAAGMVGILTGADLVKALTEGCLLRPAGVDAVTDEAIRGRLLSELEQQDWWSSSSCAVEVEQGVVRFTGFVENDAERRACQVAAENIPGVSAVQDHRMSLSELPVMF
jgi:CBS domain-containing protein